MQGSSVILCHLCRLYGMGAWHRVLDLGADVMLPPFAGETEVQLQHHREAFS